ncbi:hypothetical protein SAMN02745124_04248 [Desulfofustis glycolicus DSM 9705]|uniref:Uncharacterized protein n=1 Tax=Desulfofustis glycolicus DSM 9705 TaxID=1121409 RepID=A0A1M5YNA9_9BACT|nr:hypothetical protein SAMN02745124_04248 [Desulfofustis glycolicus DSM 9705]
MQNGALPHGSLKIVFVVIILRRRFSHSLDEVNPFSNGSTLYDLFDADAMPPLVTKIEQIVENILFGETNCANSCL